MHVLPRWPQIYSSGMFVVKYWGIPADVVSDRDARFTGRFWTSLFELMGTQLLYD